MSKEKNKLKPIDTPVYRYWSALYMSFYSRRLYVDVGKRWRGFAFLYLLLTIALFSIPFALRMGFSLNQSFKEQITDPLSKIPVFYIQNGEVSFDKPMPYLIKNDQNQVVVLIDTTGKVNDFPAEYPYLTILINKNKISLKVPSLKLFNMKDSKPSKGTPLVQTFDKGTNLVFDGKKIAEQSSIRNLKYFSQMMIYPLVVAIFFSIFIVFFLVLAFLGQVFSSIFFSFSVTFMQSSRLLITAGTPMMLLLFIMLTFNAIFQGSGFILFALLIAYYSLALFSLRAESRRIVMS
ncbi:DUF1189 domain-containing protein [Fluoribacter dumoffii]|uniref:DUF1189 family protein n=1 Tax=Fluoribacter dumoffii TaxID=463 RepID=UPI002243FB5B|nr:DUF1189 family protein [Fluoribacter dumoffii]MCW8385411.1 DUF1189 domain-containing protein [Fluoribacter dumoffii]MCW8418464.1 DUF1189 domain-containing protein [Fluoribacter dumoffii]MCW8453694.1 DUF1189 domain-containing protein [Fluoribacter dumoffii]MCW8462235.1 DUF1189 domain-containing protein [Fluoribacter dumoffii]MCW8482447.1 DUF1189 domain-containing protein [Fluoribacter dumoffii]